MTGSKFIYLHLPLVIDQNVVKTGNISPLFPLDNDKNLIFIILVSHPKNGTFLLVSLMYMEIFTNPHNSRTNELRWKGLDSKG